VIGARLPATLAAFHHLLPVPRSDDNEERRGPPLAVRRPSQREADVQGIEKEDAEVAFRRGYEHGAIETFHAVERFLDPATRKVLRAWIEQDVYAWRIKAMLAYPPVWRLRMLTGSRSADSAPFFP
jgi:hypothetical protein